MPCFTVQQTRIELGTNTNADHMLAALNALKLNALRAPNGYIAFNGGSFHIDGTLTLSLRGNAAEQRAAEIKRAYMTQATMATAAKFGFSIKQTGANKFTALKRTLAILLLASLALCAHAADVRFRLITGTVTTLSATNYANLPLPEGFTMIGLPLQFNAPCVNQERGIASLNGRLIVMPARCDTLIALFCQTPTNTIVSLTIATKECNR